MSRLVVVPWLNRRDANMVRDLRVILQLAPNWPEVRRG